MSAKRPAVKRLSRQEEERIVESLRAAEKRTSAEMRVHVEARTPGEPLAAAREWFARLGMAHTRERNAVLVYVSLAERRCAIWADQAAHERLGDPVWDEACRILGERSAEAGVEAGIIDAVAFLGGRLAGCFPRGADDVNELPDDLSASGEALDSRD